MSYSDYYDKNGVKSKNDLDVREYLEKGENERILLWMNAILMTEHKG